jgi:subfamily B ATP-binding cassette protein MsbA
MLAGLVVIPIVVIVVQTAARRIRKAALAVQGALADVSGELQEGISAIQVVRSFANELFEISKFRKSNVSAYSAEMRRALIEALMVPLLMLAGALGLGILLLYGAWQVSTGIILPGDLVMIIALLHKTNDEANKLGRTYMAFQDTLAASDRIFSFLHIESSIKDAPDAIELDKCEGRVEFRDVSFRYPTGDEVLHHIDVTADPGSVIAFVGPSGAGKSSLAKLIPRFYDVSDGQVLVDGLDVRRVSIQSLRECLGIVPQETILFHGTVRENIAYGKLDASDEEIEQAALSANAHDFIALLENGYDTVVGERGTRLSGGQRQRISIARAILKDPRILILDEATSNLDTESEKIVQAALERLMQGRTTFVIAHRLTTIRNASEIIVLQGGKIVDRGTHDELMSREGLYRELYEVESLSGQ